MRKIPLLLLIVIIAAGCRQESFEEKLNRIHDEALTIDSHTDTPLWFTRNGFDLNTAHDPYETRSRVDFPRMQEGGLDAVFFAAFVGQGERNPLANLEAKKRVLQIIDSIYSNVDRYPETAIIAKEPQDVIQAEKEGKRIVYIGMENGYPIGTEIENLDLFYEKGVRYITLCHTGNNDICDSSTDTTEHIGLSDFGEKVVKRMNELGMIIDVTHISDSSFYDVIKHSNAPVIASHSCARAVRDHVRNLNDDMLLKLKKNGGVIQMCLYTDYVKEPDPQPERDSAYQALRVKYDHFKDLTDEQYRQARIEWREIDKTYPRKLATVADLIDHIDHVVELIGVDYVGIGSDFDGGGGLKDCYDVSEIKNITSELFKRGYTEEEIKKIWGGNLMRVFKKVRQQAEQTEG
ncbi:MAG: dipeptidase [Bacteroidales bacterium]|nr:dipeptidase [Bacteroidales bacterium]MCF8349916.1 dipeptidase [Bacteroidales bacterium]MCF8376797.1 dipeptidase [Bacteroidales bacterium]MCF8401969.1 dipeptidase [Bacteroidales bacterium]